jgi:hypothetical protein
MTAGFLFKFKHRGESLRRYDHLVFVSVGHSTRATAQEPKTAQDASEEITALLP